MIGEAQVITDWNRYNGLQHLKLLCVKEYYKGKWEAIPQEGKKIFANHASGKDIIPRCINNFTTQRQRQSNSKSL